MNKWKILLVDDDKLVHLFIESALKNLEFENKSIELYHAYNLKQAKEFLDINTDTAVLISDLVMEKDLAGLELIDYVRNIIKNRNVRIILETARPEKAPEDVTVASYDINLYLDKKDLNEVKLRTAVLTSLRSYRDIILLERGVKGLEKIIKEPHELLFLEDIYAFLEEWYEKVKMFIKYYSIVGEYKVGIKYKNFVIGELSEEEYGESNGNLIKKEFEYKDDKGLFIVKFKYDINPIEKGIITTFIENIYLSFISSNYFIDMHKSHKEIIYKLSDIIEARSGETGFHVRSVAEIAYIIGESYGLDQKRLDVLKLAAPLHDIGKIGISDTILNKPEKLTDEEFEIMKEHPIIGYNILKNSKWEVFDIAAKISLQHHEKWNGKGYPFGLKEDNIILEARIVSIADVFDALTQDRVYRKAWPIDQAVNYISSFKGIAFDPVLVDIFLDNIEKIKKLKSELQF
jgi:HD-GYP domain-containing protein (c-di-GMP phosphodiesterase class II)